MPFLEVIGWCSVVVLGWPVSVLVLGPVVGALLQAEVICYLCPAQGHLVELQSDLKLAAMCVGPRGLWKRARCNLRLATKAQGIPRVTTT